MEFTVLGNGLPKAKTINIYGVIKGWPRMQTFSTKPNPLEKENIFSGPPFVNIMKLTEKREAVSLIKDKFKFT